MGLPLTRRSLRDLEVTLHLPRSRERPLPRKLPPRESLSPLGTRLERGRFFGSRVTHREERDFTKWAKERIPAIFKEAQLTHGDVRVA